MRRFARRLVGDEEFHNHLLCGNGAIAGRLHFHADGRRPLAGGRKHALAFDLHHAGSAIAIRSVVRLWRIAEMRDIAPLAFGNLPDRLADTGLNLLAIQFERDDLRSASFPANRSDRFAVRDRHAAVRSVLATRGAFGVMAVTLR